MAFDNEKELIKQSWKLVGRSLWQKGKLFKARCDYCNIVSDLSLNNLDKLNKNLVWSCNLCRTSSRVFVNQNRITQTQNGTANR